MFQRILLTGGTGFVGSWLAPALAKAYPKARLAMLCRPGDSIKRTGWNMIEAAILDRAAVEKVVLDFQPDLVVHMAAQSSVAAGLKATEETWRVNFVGTLELASACAQLMPKATFFFVSSAEVYGLSFRDGVVTEATPLRPNNTYARSKMAAEAMLHDVLTLEQRLIVVRPLNHTGPGQDQRFALPSFAAQIAEIEIDRRAPQIEVGNLDVQRDFLDVRDVCEAYVALLGKAHELPNRSIFNIGSGQQWRVRDLLEMMRNLARRPFAIVIDPTRLRSSDIPTTSMATENIKAATGWQPTTPIETVVERLLDYWRDISQYKRY